MKNKMILAIGTAAMACASSSAAVVVGWTMRRTSAAALLSLAVAIPAHAAFTGVSVTAIAGPTSTPVGATTVYRVWANFSGPAGTNWASAVANFRITSQTGFTGFVHNDNNTGGSYSIASGSWFTINSNNTYGATDSWVSLTEPTTFPVSTAIPVYGSGFPAGWAQWYPGDFLNNPQIPGILGAGVSWSADPGGPYYPINGQQLLGQFVIAADAQVCLAAEVRWGPAGVGSSSPVTFDFNGNCVPAPGAIALLGFAGFARRRTR